MPTPFTLTEVTTLVTGPVRTANTLKVIAKISSFAAQICWITSSVENDSNNNSARQTILIIPCQWTCAILSAQLSKSKKIPVDDLFARTPRHLYITGMLGSLNMVFECPLEREIRCNDKMWSRESYRACIPVWGRMLSVNCLGINVNGRQWLRSRRDRPMLWDTGRGGEYKSTYVNLQYLPWQYFGLNECTITWGVGAVIANCRVHWTYMWYLPYTVGEWEG